MITRRLLTRALLIALLSVAPAAEAGWLIVDEGGNQTFLSRGRLKVAPKNGEGMSMVLDVARARMLVADAGRKAYWEGTVEEYCQQVQGMMAGFEKQMAEQMKDLPPAQREQMMQAMKQMGRGAPSAPAGPRPRVTVERTAETETIAGLPARKHRVLTDGKLYEELWLTTDAALVRELDLGRAPETFGRMFACAGGGAERIEASAEYRQIFAQGWPLRAVYHGEGKPSGRLLVTKVEQREVAEREFAAPAGFRAVPLMEIFGRPR